MPGELTAGHHRQRRLALSGRPIIVVDAARPRTAARRDRRDLDRAAPPVIKGYWNNPKATAESFTAGFWHSGDLGSIDARRFRARVRSPERHDQPRRPARSIRPRWRSCWPAIPACSRARSSQNPARCSASACMPSSWPARRRRATTLARLVRGAAVRLQGAGDHAAEWEPSAQSQWQGDERRLRETLGA